MKIRESKAQIGGGSLLGVFSLALYFYIIPTQIIFVKQQLGVSPQYFPNILAGFLFILSLALGFQGYRGRNRINQKTYSVTWQETKLVLLTLLIIGLQIIGFEQIGYLIPAILAIAVCMFIYGHKNYVTIALVSILLPLSIKLFFEQMLQVYLP
jgi:hypothetical protein